MPIRVALIGTGKIAVANHIPGIRFCRDAEVVALSDPNPAALAEASAATGVTRTYADPFALLKDAPVDAVIVATPNRFHRDLVVAAAESGRHVLCEKPLAMTVEQAEQMVVAAEQAGVRHMTAFTYRFVPAMQYLHHLVSSGALGTPWHFRAQRFQDWGRTAIGWRQVDGRGRVGRGRRHAVAPARLRTLPRRPDATRHRADASRSGRRASTTAAANTSRTPRTGWDVSPSSCTASPVSSRA